jgi:hypothetical protein
LDVFFVLPYPFEYAHAYGRASTRFRRYLGPRLGIRSVRLASSVGSIRAVVGGCVVLVVVVSVVVVPVVVQPTRARKLTAAITGINFFMVRFYRTSVVRSILFLAPSLAVANRVPRL